MALNVLYIFFTFFVHITYQMSVGKFERRDLVCSGGKEAAAASVVALM